MAVPYLLTFQLFWVCVASSAFGQKCKRKETMEEKRIKNSFNNGDTTSKISLSLSLFIILHSLLSWKVFCKVLAPTKVWSIGFSMQTLGRCVVFFVCLYLSCICMRKRDFGPSRIILRFEWHEKGINTFGSDVVLLQPGEVKKEKKGKYLVIAWLRIESIRNRKNLFLRINRTIENPNFFYDSLSNKYPYILPNLFIVGIWKEPYLKWNQRLNLCPRSSTVVLNTLCYSLLPWFVKHSSSDKRQDTLCIRISVKIQSSFLGVFYCQKYKP